MSERQDTSDEDAGRRANESAGEETRHGRRRPYALVVLLLLVALGLTTSWWLTRDAPHADETGETTPTDPSDETDPEVASSPESPQTSPSPSEPDAVAGPFVIAGRVVSESDGEGVAGATIDVVDASGIVATVETEIDGGFRTGALPLDAYVLRARAPGFGDAVLEDVVPGGPSTRVVLAPGRGLTVTLEPSTPGTVCHLGGAGLFPQRRASANASGSQCRFEGVPPGRYELGAAAKTRGASFVDVHVAPEEDDAVHRRLEMKPASTLVVHVAAGTDESGAPKPLENALVTIAPGPLHVLAFHGVSDASGRVRVPGLRPGTWYVSVRASGFLPGPAKAVAVPRDAPFEVTPRRGATVRGRVLDEESNPVPLARLVARVHTPDGARWRVDRDTLSVLNHLVRPSGTTIGRGTSSYTANNAGSFSISGLPAGRIVLEARKDGWVPTHAAVVELEAGDVAEDVVVRMTRGGLLHGRVVGPSGGGISGARVRWRVPGDDVWGWRDAVVADERGEFTLTGVGHLVELEVRAPGYQTARVEVPRAGPAHARTVELSPDRGRILGRVLGPDGPVIGAEIRALETLADPLACRGESDEEGRFEIVGCGDRTRRFELVGPSIAPIFFQARSGSEIELTATSGGTLVGDVASSSGEPLEEVTVVVSAPVSIEGGEGTHRYERAHTYENPRFELAYLPAGRYQIEISAPGYAGWRETRAVDEGGRVDLGRVSLTELARLEGYVLDELGGPVSEARVVVPGGEDVLSNDEGLYALTEVTPGTISLTAVHWLIGRGTVEVGVEPGQAPRVDIRLDEALVGDDDWVAALERAGVVLQRDEGGWIVETIRRDSVWSDTGLLRGDHVETAAMRGDRVRRVTVVREGARRQSFDVSGGAD